MNKVQKLQQLIENAENLIGKNLRKKSPEFQAWNSSLIRFCEKNYGTESSTTKRLSRRSYTLGVVTVGTPDAEYVRAMEKDLKITIAELKTLLDEEKEDLEISDSELELISENKINSKKVFIVHGRDNQRKYELYDFLYSLKLEPIILHDRVNNGKTIIEKIEKNSDVACAIILLTPDDEGRLKNSDDELKTRARQNVIFEAGYFMGKLGRNRTILINGVQDTMSDIDGILYLDINSYKSDLMRELKELNLI